MSPLLRRSVFLLFASVCVGAVLGCPASQNQLPAPAPGTVVLFAASSASLTEPGSVTLTWETKDATEVSVSQLGGAVISTEASGTARVDVTQSTVFVAIAKGTGGTDAKTAAVTVTGTLTGTPLFVAVPTAIRAGEQATLVWSAPGSTTVTVSEQGGGALDIGTQTQSGSVIVQPSKSTTYALSVDGTEITAALAVRPAIFELNLASAAPKAGDPVKLTWKTAGGQTLTLKRQGAATALYTETNPAKVESGSYEDTAPPELTPTGSLTYELTLSAGTESSQKTLVVYAAGAIAITSLKVPGYVKVGRPANVSWATNGASQLSLSVNGAPSFRAQSQTEVNAGSFFIPSISAATTVELVVSNRNNVERRQTATIAVVGLPTFNSFQADRQNIVNGSVDPVVLSWSVTNARHVRITENGFVLIDRAGLLDTGTATVYPNQPSTTYVLTADNGDGDTIAPQSTTVTVTTPARLSFQVTPPVGATGQVVGTTVTGGSTTSIFGLPTVKKGNAGDAFVDISTTGIEIGSLPDDSGGTVVEIPSFSTVLYGQRLTGSSLSVSPNGWLVFSTVAVSGPVAPTSGIGTSLEPLALAPFFKDLARGATGRAHWLVEGSEEARRLIVQWSDMGLYSTPNSRLTFQVQLYATGKVVFAYRSMELGGGSNGVAGIVNRNETEVLTTTAAPVTGDVYAFFDESTLPAPLKLLDSTPYLAATVVNGRRVWAEGQALRPGDFAITEVNPYPAAAVVDGEWLELANFTTQPVDLNGWSLQFAGSTYAIGQSLVVPANGRIVVGQSLTAAEGATVTAAYPNTHTLADAAGSLSLSFGGVAYSRISWSTIARGTSVVADPPSKDLVFATASVLQPACLSTVSYGTNGQLGTPGAANPRCFGYSKSSITGAFESIAATGTSLVTSTSSPGDLNDKTFALTLPAPVSLNGVATSVFSVSTNGWLAPGTIPGAFASNSATPSTVTPTTISPLWDDLKINAMGSGIYWQRKDPDAMPSTNDEYTLISWENVGVASSAVTSSLNFQVRLYDNGTVEYHYGSMTSSGSTTAFHQGASATTWLKNTAGDVALLHNANSTSPGVGSNTGLRFTYTP